MNVITWIGSHANKLAALVRAFMYMAVALNWTALSDAQIGTILLFTEAGLALFVESNTVSKDRVGERIAEKVAQITGTNG